MNSSRSLFPKFFHQRLPQNTLTWPVIGLGVMIVATALDRYRFDVASFGIRVEHVALIVVTGIVIVRWKGRSGAHESPRERAGHSRAASPVLWRSRTLSPQLRMGTERPTLSRFRALSHAFAACSFERAVPSAQFRWDDALLALYLGVALLASVLNAPVLRESLKFLALMAAAVVIYWLTKSLVVDAVTFNRAVKILMVVGVVEAIYGVFTLIAFPLGLDLGIQYYPYGPRAPNGATCNFTISPYGTLFEANIFGSYTGAIGLIVTTLLLSHQARPRRRLLALSLAALLGAVALSITRTALLGYLLGLLVAFLIAEDRHWGIRVTTMAASAALLLLISASDIGLMNVALRYSRSALPPRNPACDYSAYQPPQPTPTFTPKPTTTPAPGAATAPAAALTVTPRLTSGPPSPPTPTRIPRPIATPGPALPPISSLVPIALSRLLSVDTLGERLDNYRLAIQDWQANPWIGNGANAFGQKYESTSHLPAWLSNIEVMALHDTGIIGVAILFVWLAWLVRDWLRAVHSAPSSFTRTALIGLGVGGIALLVAYQLTTAFWLGFTWVYLALLRAGSLIVQREKER
ncbi:MAG: hypothetical protein HY259_06945 [Chloroflexi bacterium]|nr:hypothetical protein [Chloroflexota bacterium]